MKVHMDCAGCQSKIKKALQKLHGTFSNFVTYSEILFHCLLIIRSGRCRHRHKKSKGDSNGLGGSKEGFEGSEENWKES